MRKREGSGDWREKMVDPMFFFSLSVGVSMKLGGTNNKSQEGNQQ